MSSDIKLQEDKVILEGHAIIAKGAEISGDLALQGILELVGDPNLVPSSILELNGKTKSLESTVQTVGGPGVSTVQPDQYETRTISISQATIKYIHDVKEGGLHDGNWVDCYHKEIDLIDEIHKIKGLKDDVDALKKQIEELKTSISNIVNPPPIIKTFSIMGDVKYLNDGVVRMGVDVKLQEIFDGNAFDIASVVSSRGDGSFKITCSSDKLHNPNNPKLFLQAFSSGKPFSNQVEIKAGTNDNVELICPPPPSG